MNRLELRTEFLQRATDSPATTAQMDLWSQRGANYIANLLGLFPTSGSINLVASTQSYSLTTNFTTFLRLNGRTYPQYYDGADYTPLKVVSRNWLDTFIPDWRNADAGDPVACFQENGYILTYPTPSESKTNGLLVYYFAKPTQMTADSSDPFNSRTDLEDLHEAILLYMVWKAKQAIGEYVQAREAKAEFITLLRELEYKIADDEVTNEPFRPYHLGTTVTYSDPSVWGIL